MEIEIHLSAAGESALDHVLKDLLEWYAVLFIHREEEIGSMAAIMMSAAMRILTADRRRKKIGTIMSVLRLKQKS